MNTAVALLTFAEEVDGWAETNRRVQATVDPDSHEYARAAGRLLAYERVRDTLRAHAAEFLE